jgi:nitrate reductase delta subunit
MRTLKALAALLAYPEPALLEALPEIRRLIAAEPAIGAEAGARLAALMDELAATDVYELQEKYVDLFDRGHATSLHLFEHVHGDARERGPAMVDLGALYARNGLVIAANELPDYLPAVLEYLSTRPFAEAREMLADCAHVLRAIGEALAGRESRYCGVFGALLEIAGGAALDYRATRPRVRADAPAAIDEEWADAPVIFGPGCAEARPRVQTVRFMNKTG